MKMKMILWLFIITRWKYNRISCIEANTTTETGIRKDG